MNDTVDKLNQLRGQMKALEDSATRHEQAARADRAKRDEVKAEISSLQAVINDARVVNAVEGSVMAAGEARAAAEAAKKEADGIVSSLKEKEKQLDELLAKAAKE